MPSQQTTIFSPTELAYLHISLSLQPPIRPDARSPTTFRPLIGEIDLLPSTNGSARLCFADGTEGIVGVKAEVGRTGHGPTDEASGPEEASRSGDETRNRGDVETKDHPIEKDGESSWVEVTIDLPGQREDDFMVTSITQMIHEGLVTDGTLPRKLYINSNWHWKLYIDVMTFPHISTPPLLTVLQILLLSPLSSYPLPLLSLSTHLALFSTRLPALISQGEEDPLFNDDWEAALPLYQKPNTKAPAHTMQNAPKPPVSIMAISVGPNLFFDPSREELAVADAVVVVTVTSHFSPNDDGDGEGNNGVKILAIRTLDPPSALTTSSSAALGGEPGFDQMEDGEGDWKPKRGGMKREVLSKLVDLCCKKGGMGEEILEALKAFV